MHLSAYTGSAHHTLADSSKFFGMPTGISRLPRGIGIAVGSAFLAKEGVSQRCRSRSILVVSKLNLIRTDVTFRSAAHDRNRCIRGTDGGVLDVR